MQTRRVLMVRIGIAVGVCCCLFGWQAAAAQDSDQPQSEVIPCAGVLSVSINSDGRTAVLITEQEGVFGFDFETKALQQLLPAVQPELYEEIRDELPLRSIDARGSFVVIVDLLESATVLAKKGRQDNDTIAEAIKRLRADHKARVCLWEHNANVWRRTERWTLDNLPFASPLVPLVTEDGAVYIAHNDPDYELRKIDTEDYTWLKTEGVVRHLTPDGAQQIAHWEADAGYVLDFSMGYTNERLIVRCFGDTIVVDRESSEVTQLGTGGLVPLVELDETKLVAFEGRFLGGGTADLVAFDTSKREMVELLKDQLPCGAVTPDGLILVALRDANQVAVIHAQHERLIGCFATDFAVTNLACTDQGRVLTFVTKDEHVEVHDLTDQLKAIATDRGEQGIFDQG